MPASKSVHSHTSDYLSGHPASSSRKLHPDSLWYSLWYTEITEVPLQAEKRKLCSQIAAEKIIHGSIRWVSLYTAKVQLTSSNTFPLQRHLQCCQHLHMSPPPGQQLNMIGHASSTIIWPSILWPLQLWHQLCTLLGCDFKPSRCPRSKNLGSSIV